MQQRRWRADAVIVEDIGVGSALVRDPPEDLRDKISGYRPHEPKVIRFIAQTAKIDDGLVCVPPDAPWLDDFRKELLAFPNGLHDDQADALSQLLDWALPGLMANLVDRAQHGGRPSGALRPKGRPRDQRGSRPGRRLSF